MAKLKISWKDIIIMQYVAHGFTLLEISKKTEISVRGVESRIARLKKHLNCKSLAHLAVTLLRENIIK